MCDLKLVQKTFVLVPIILCGLFATDVFAELLYEDFSSTDGLTLNGTTAIGVNEPDGRVLWLTPSVANATGSAFTSSRVNTSQFSTWFTFRITDSHGGNGDPTLGADGLAFVLQSVSSSSIGSGGGCLGYGGIAPSVIVEFDTHSNSTVAGSEFNDPSANHVGINLNGNPDHGEDALYTITVGPDFDDGNLWHVWIDYDGSELMVWASEQAERPDDPLLTCLLDISSILGTLTK